MRHNDADLFDARALHGWLGNRDRFATWVRDRIAQYGFEEGLDYFGVSRKTRGRPRQDYLLTRDTAK